MQQPLELPDGTVLPAQSLYARKVALDQFLASRTAAVLGTEITKGVAAVRDSANAQLSAGKVYTPTGEVPLPGAQQITADQTFRNKLAEGEGEQANSVSQAATTAGQVHQRVAELQQASEGFRPGATGEIRKQASDLLVDAYQTIGLTPPPWVTKMATDSDVIGKISGQMVADLVRTLGPREALGVFQQVKAFNPNISMTSGGFATVLRSIDQGAYRTEDLSRFQNDWLTTHSNTAGMQAAFDKAYPPAMYASRVMPRPMPTSESALQPGFYYQNPQGATFTWDGRAMQRVTQ
jgi:hypothetical protein